jgi:hypothetical protein
MGMSGRRASHFLESSTQVITGMVKEIKALHILEMSHGATRLVVNIKGIIICFSLSSGNPTLTHRTNLGYSF